MTTKRIAALLLWAMVAFSGCAPANAAQRALASIEPLAISQRSSSPIEAQPSAASPPATTNDNDQSDQAAVKNIIERANNAQAEAFAYNDPTLMRATAVDSYYQELVRINGSLARDGVSAIKLLKIEWGAIAVTGNTATATSYETWRTDYTDGTGDESRDRNDYTLVRDSSGWKIKADDHTDDLDAPGGEAPAPSPAPRPLPAPSPFAQPNRAGRSHNWSGYSATGGTFTGVSATWTVPRPGDSTFGADAAWVGIGGVRSRDLIQAGTEQTVSPTGRVSYQAWIEMLPQISRPVQLKISPGDSVSVSLAEQQPGSWLISFKDNTTGQSFETAREYESSHSSAEWVEEAPSGRRGVMTLSNFGTISFSAGGAVKDGKTVTIAQAGGRPITMLDRNDQPIAQPSQLAPDGASFSVTRVNIPASLPAAPAPSRRQSVPPAEQAAA